MQEYQFETGYSWDTGLLREINEDSILCTSFNLKTHLGAISAGLFAVADGMGGHSGGEIASDIALRTLQVECISRLFAQSPFSPFAILADAFAEANSKIMNSASSQELNGMGTTLTAALVIGENMYVAHIGDSRCYIINTRETIQITKDHSVVQQLIDTGVITPDQAHMHPRKHEITRAVGFSHDIYPDLHQIKLYANDNILLCSDGLCSVLPSTTISETIISSSTTDQACRDLTALANLAGGPDNISIIIVKPSNLPSWQAVINAQTSIRSKECQA